MTLTACRGHIIVSPIVARPNIVDHGGRACMTRGRLFGSDENSVDAHSLHADDLESVAGYLDGVPLSRYAPQAVDDEIGHGLVVTLREADTGKPVEFLEDQATIDADRIVVLHYRVLWLDAAVVLVVDLAHEFLDQILERDDAVRAAVFVHDPGDVVTRPAHDGERLQHIVGCGKGQNLACNVCDRVGAGAGRDRALRIDEIPDVHKPQDVVH